MDRPVQFGLFQPQIGLPFSMLKERAEACEAAGFHSIWFTDHMWARGMEQVDFLEGWTLMSSMSMVTSRLRIGGLVLCNSFRNPAFLAKMAASLDNISQGRLEIGLGAGWMNEEYEAYGYPFPSGGTRADQLDEGVQIMKRMFSGTPASFDGAHYRVADAHCNPKPVQQPHPPITIGAMAERKGLKIVAEHADRWNCPAAAAHKLEQKWKVVTDHCRAVGRDPDDIEISEQTLVVLGKDKADFDRKYPVAQKTLGRLAKLERCGACGDPAGVIDALKAKHDKGVTLFTMMFSDVAQDEFLATLELFAAEVMPAFQDA